MAVEATSKSASCACPHGLCLHGYMLVWQAVAYDLDTLQGAFEQQSGQQAYVPAVHARLHPSFRLWPTT
jgi:hypothetical protein